MTTTPPASAPPAAEPREVAAREGLLRAPAVHHPRLGSHIPALDGIRGIAIALVLVSHFALMTPDGRVDRLLFSVLQSGGVTGVQLFFVLSGFLITGILFDSKGSEYFFRNFYIRRALRIFPLYYGFLVLLFVVLPLVHPSDSEAFRTLQRNQGWYWTYLTNFLIAVRGTQEATPLGTHHFWSLAVEEQFYFVWPLVVWLLSPRALLRASAATVVGVLLLRIALIAAGVPHLAIAEMTFTRVDALAAGAFLAVLMRAPGGVERAARWALPVVLASLVVLAWVFAGHGGGEGNVALATAGYTGLTLFFAGLLVLAITAPPGSIRNRLITTRLLLALGEKSYGLYVFHLPLQVLLGGLGWLTYPMLVERIGSPWAAQIVYLVVMSALSYAIAWLSFRFYETRFLKLKDRFPYTNARRRASTEREIKAEADQLTAP